MNRRKFFYNGLLLTAVGLAVRSVSMAFNSYLTRVIGAEGIGVFTLIMTVYSFAVTFATSGISLTVTRLVASAIGDGREGSVRKIMRHACVYALVFSLSASLILFFFAEYFGMGALGDVRTVVPLRILSLSLPAIALTSVFGGYFVGVRRVSRNAVVQVLGQVFKISVTLFFVLRYAGGGVADACIALCLSTVSTELLVFLVGLLQFVYDRHRTRVKQNGSAAFSDVASMALPIAVSAYIRSALLTLEHVLIPQRLRRGGSDLSESLSAYGMLHGMALPILTFPMAPLSSFSGLLVPEFAESLASGQGERMRRIADEALNLTLCYSAVAAVFLYVFSEELGFVIYDSYGAGSYIAFMAPVVPIMYLDHVTDSMLKGIGEQVYSMWVNISDSLLSVILVYVLIPVMGISGYAVVIILMEAFNFALSAVRLRKTVRFRIDLMRSFLLPFASSFIAASLCRSLFIMNGSEARPVLTLVKLLFSVSIFFAIYIPTSSFLKKVKTEKSAIS